MSTLLLLGRRFLADHARNPANVLVLILTPLVFVTVAADPLSGVSDVLGGGSGSTDLGTITAGWAAAFVAAVGMYFQVSAARLSDRRLVIAGLPRRTLVLARMLTGMVLALLASTAALGALAAQGAVDQLGRVAAGTAAFALIYLCLGAIVGALVSDALNGTMLLLFIWIVDVFFGPAMNGTDSPPLRLLPTHFVTLWMADLAPTHGGPAPGVAATAWVVGALVVGFGTVVRTAGPGPRGRRHDVRSASQLGAGLRMAWRGWRRNPTLWALLVTVPTVFIWLADVLTPSGSTPVRLREGGASVVLLFDPAHMHAGTMAPVAVGSLAAVAGVFIALDGRSGDQRLLLAGQKRAVVHMVRTLTVAAAGALATGVSLGLVALLFDAHQWPVFALGNLVVAITYGLVGMILGPLAGRVSGAFLAFLLPFLDLAIGQSPMLQSGPADWAAYLPGYGGLRLVLDGALTESFDELSSLLAGFAWIIGLLLLSALQMRRERAPSSSWTA